MDTVMELLDPIEKLEDWSSSVADLKQPGESMQPQRLDDQPQQVASIVGRQNVSYDPIWAAVEAVYPKWQPVRCNSARRALLLASSATQHRTKTFEVHRRGRLVCLRHIPEPVVQEPTQAQVSA